MPCGAAADDEVAEIPRVVEADLGAQRELAGAGLQAAGRQFDVLAPQCTFDVGDGERASRERLAVDPDTHRRAPRARQGGPRHTRHSREAIDKITLGVVGDLELRHLIGIEAEEHHRLAVGIGFRDLRRVCLGWQLGDHASDAVADIVGCGVDVTRGVELHPDAGALVFAV